MFFFKSRLYYHPIFRLVIIKCCVGNQRVGNLLSVDDDFLDRSTLHTSDPLSAYSDSTIKPPNTIMLLLCSRGRHVHVPLLQNKRTAVFERILIIKLPLMSFRHQV
jgi:hypothetical protein